MNPTAWKLCTDCRVGDERPDLGIELVDDRARGRFGSEDADPDCEIVHLHPGLAQGRNIGTIRVALVGCDGEGSQLAAIEE